MKLKIMIVNFIIKLKMENFGFLMIKKRQLLNATKKEINL